MLSFMSDRRVLAISAACITAAIFLFLLGTYPSWKDAVGRGISWRPEAPVASEPSKPPLFAQGDRAGSPPVSKTPGPQAPVAQPGVAAGGTPAGGVVQAHSTPSDAAAQNVSASRPSFDVVRVEPTGDSVIAARAVPASTILLLDQGRVIARAQADASGQVAFVPPVLSPGDHSLMLSVGEPDAPGALSSQSVAVSVPERAKAAPLVALLQPDQPTKLLGGAASPAQAPGGAQVPAVSVGAIDVEETGSVFAAGRATPASQCRIYLNGSFVAGVTAGSDGTWSLKIQRGMRPGHYNVRVDELASAAGDVRARAEVPFDYPTRAAGTLSLLRPRKGQAAPLDPAHGGAPPQPASASDTVAGRDRLVLPGAPRVASAAADGGAAAGSATIVAQLLTTKVIHGDSLWRISRKMFGHGRRYTQIYAANTSQIRNPKLIYPGQIFVMPQTP